MDYMFTVQKALWVHIHHLYMCQCMQGAANSGGILLCEREVGNLDDLCPVVTLYKYLLRRDMFLGEVPPFVVFFSTRRCTYVK